MRLRQAACSARQSRQVGNGRRRQHQGEPYALLLATAMCIICPCRLHEAGRAGVREVLLRLLQHHMHQLFW